jgi:hypothetical protein
METVEKCKDCGHLISKKAMTCPHCGRPYLLRIVDNVFPAVLIAGFLLVGIGWGIGAVILKILE